MFRSFDVAVVGLPTPHDQQIVLFDVEVAVFETSDAITIGALLRPLEVS